MFDQKNEFSVDYLWQMVTSVDSHTKALIPVPKTQNEIDPASILTALLQEQYQHPLRPTITARLPWLYSLIPPSLRVRLARWATLYFRSKKKEPSLEWPISEAGVVIASRLQQLSYPSLFPKWPDDAKSCLCLTHDIDTRNGFEHIEKIAAIEEERGLRSCWNVVLEQEPYGRRILHSLKERGHEIGCHGIRHDHRLPFIPADQLETELQSYQPIMESLNIQGFRSPALLRSLSLMKIINQFFDYDSSYPDTEPKTLAGSQGGCGWVWPYQFGTSLIELPLTIPLESTLIFLGYKPPQILELWLKKREWIRQRRGLGMLCLHVDRHWLKYANSLSIYPKFLDLVLADETTKVILPRNLVSWLKDGKFALAQVNF